ncbi:winged helix family transcriptional regulator [Cyanobium sp. WAJ14-Wanaka]|uniref:winged helix family transcriptional regulator n=1 Tax=Cyanobium sp. WAJ14-Wanaka TaxID=2823725 RepID=UPI0020CEAD69|nr:response regulator transcription factor [Cyanobium sp. WAJ14-Wanaka]MCP9775127.1 response regulator transcription factor [Cyanobium sp. WAJ14-Wanaka]
MAEALILLLGQEASCLAPRLEASGYLTCEHPPGGHPELTIAPDAVLISAAEAGQIPWLRQQLGRVPLLLDVEQDTIEARSLCLSTGADDFWLSCLGPSDLLMRLRLHLNLSQQVSIPIQLLQVGDLVVNPSARQVKLASRTVNLTAREYQLLLLLLERKGTVVSREQILRLIWADQQGASSNVIEVYVRYLRQKLEGGGERRLIHTVRGQGYCLSERLPHLEPTDAP